MPHSAVAGASLIVSQAGSLCARSSTTCFAEGAALHSVAEVAHRTSILPLVLQGVGLAVLPSAWAPLARWRVCGSPGSTPRRTCTWCC